MVDNNSDGDQPTTVDPVTFAEWLQSFVMSRGFASLMLIILTTWLGPDGAKWAGFSVQAAQEGIPVILTLLAAVGLTSRASTAKKVVELKKTKEALATANAKDPDAQ